MMRCPQCNTQLHWQSDFDYDDMGHEGEGVCGIYTCPEPKCIVEDVHIYMNG
jgi:hypothetical protein